MVAAEDLDQLLIGGLTFEHRGLAGVPVANRPKGLHAATGVDDERGRTWIFEGQ